MQLHERFLSLPKLNLDFLQSHKTNNELANRDVLDSLENLDILRMILVQRFHDFYVTKKPLRPCDSISFNLDVKKILRLKLSQEKLLVLQDVLILQMTFFTNEESLALQMKNFRSSNENCIFENADSRILYMKFLETFLDAFDLKSFVFGIRFEKITQEIGKAITLDANGILNAMEDSEWKFLPSFFAKSISLIGRDEILPQLCDLILRKKDNPQNLFSILSIVIETWFPSSSEDFSGSTSVICFREDIWSLLLEELTSSIQYVRKQALYLTKKLSKMVKVQLKQEKNLSTKNGIIPFVCKENKTGEMAIDNVANIFFLVFEGLEEKQKQFIIPILPFLDTLLKGCQEHRNCGDCFNVSWLHVIFKRILQHENNFVMKEGLKTALKMDPNLLDESFIQFLANSLNSMSLYKLENDQEYPEIVIEVSNCLSRAGKNDADLISRFLSAFSKISWGPVSIYHVTSAIRLVQENNSKLQLWDENCLKHVKILVEENLKKHSKMLRYASQTNMVESLIVFTKNPDLLMLENVLSAFPPNEALSRNSFCWENILKWLKKDEEVKFKAREFVVNFFEAFTKDEHNYRSSFSMMLTILYDAGIIFEDSSCSAKKSFCKFLNCLWGISVRPYANSGSIIQALELVSSLLDFCEKNSERDRVLVNLIFPYIESGLDFVLSKFKNASGLRYEDEEKLAKIADTFLRWNKKDTHHIQLQCLEILKNLEKCDEFQRLFAMRILYLCEKYSLEQSKETEENNEILGSLLRIYQQAFRFSKKHSVDSTGKLVSEYFVLVGKFFVTRLRRSRKSENFVELFEHASVLLDSSGMEVVPVVCELFYGVITKNLFRPEDSLMIGDFLQLCWTSALHGKKSVFFLASVEWIVEILRVLVDKGSETLREITKEVIEAILNEGNEVLHLKKLVLSRLLSSNVEFLNEILVDCLLHGAVIRQDQKIEIQTCESISRIFRRKTLSGHGDIVSRLNYNLDATIRAQATKELVHLVGHSNMETEILFHLLMQKLNENKRKRYFGDSHVHRRNYRILQALLILQPTLNKDCKTLLHNVLCELLLSDTHQHSVRLMSEWLLTRIYTEDEELRTKIWHLFTEMNEKRPGSLRSVLCMVYHVSSHLPVEQQKIFLDIALSHITPCCMGQQFSMRLYSQVIFTKIYDILKTRKELRIIEEKYMSVFKGVEESLRHGNLMTNSVKLNEDFYLTVFCTEKNYSLETIYSEFSRLTNVCPEEWISPEIFEDLGFIPNSKYWGSLALHNLDDEINRAKIPYYISKSEDADASSMRVDDVSDIQKKVIPWKTIVPFGDNFTELQTAFKNREKMSDPKKGIVIVASLVERLPNLGGITRTCEIFGAQELVISNLKHLQSKDFQNLSVSAENHIKITEVKPYELPAYFLSQKELGWSLTGAEQTMNSISLIDMNFEEKTILVLGNEKNGIPANLIPLLDKCVEIPQLGVIRSLNVHVTSAICVWQYASQHLLK